ncbi:MAG: diguanylate cyclase [Desulfococcaceae bacterium]
MNRGRILVVDDHNKIRTILRRILEKEEYEVEMAATGEEALEKIFSQIPDLVLLDVMMPGMDGLEVCRQVKSNHKYSFIYIILLTAKNTTEDEVAGLDKGADDYISKPFNHQTLLARIRKGIRQVKDKQAAYLDPLTRLYNRRVFELFFQQEKSKCGRYCHPMSLLILDLDHFKQVNDRFGHQAGDIVLKEVADIILENIRGADLAARWGGEELAIILSETEIRGAEILAEKLRKIIADHDFPEVGHVTASLGVACMTKPDDDLFSDADKALYEAKQSGRNRVVAAVACC